jgi:hypothetical protein
VLDPAIPVLLHICHESREFALQHYKIYTVGPRQLYLHPVLDVVLWIRYPVDFGPQAFRDDVRRLLQESENVPLEIPKLAISVMFWNRIETKEGTYRDLYERIRNGRVQRLCIVNDVYLPVKRNPVTGARMKLKKWNTALLGWKRLHGVIGMLRLVTALPMRRERKFCHRLSLGRLHSFESWPVGFILWQRTEGGGPLFEKNCRDLKEDDMIASTGRELGGEM